MINDTIGDYIQVVNFINTYGIDNFNVKTVKLNKPELINIISGHLGGFKSIKLMIEDKKLPINSMSTLNAQIEKPIAGVLNEKEELVVKELLPSTCVNGERTLVTQGTALLQNFVELLGSIDTKIMELDNKFNTLNVKETICTTFPSEAIPTQIPQSLLNVMDNLKAIGLKPNADIRARIKANITRYVAIKYKNKKLTQLQYGSAMSSTNRECYDMLADIIAIKDSKDKICSISELTVGFIDIANFERQEKGKKLIPLDTDSLKGFTKIDIIEKLGLLDILYYITEHKLDELGVLLPKIIEQESIQLKEEA